MVPSSREPSLKPSPSLVGQVPFLGFKILCSPPHSTRLHELRVLLSSPESSGNTEGTLS